MHIWISWFLLGYLALKCLICKSIVIIREKNYEGFKNLHLTK